MSFVAIIGACMVVAHSSPRQDETLYAAVQRVSPGPGSAAAKLWARYLPHHITSDMLSDLHTPGNFIAQSRQLGIQLGFNATSRRGAYEGPGSIYHPGPLFTHGCWWENGQNYLMSQTAPNVRHARLLPTTIHNIDSDRNLLCPCAVGTCIDAGDTMPNFCIPVIQSSTSTGSADDRLLVVLTVMTLVVGMIMALVAG
jgi:hypothetical protein